VGVGATPASEAPGVSVDRDWRMLIDGRMVHAHDRAELDVLNPATGEVVARVPSAGERDVDSAVAAAIAAFPAWRRTPAATRAAKVAELADAIDANEHELAWLDTIDIGSPIRVMRGDSRMATQQMRYFAGLSLMLRGDTIPTPEDHSLDLTLAEPFGVVGRIVPFNHPLMFAASKLAAPLVAGNVIVLKPSQHSAMSALRLGDLARDIFPPGVVNIISGTGDVAGDRLVRHPDVPRIAFTGDTRVGRLIQQAAAEAAVKVVTLELGGKNPLIVFPDAPIDEAVAGAVRGMNFTWQGQSCGSTSRLYVHASIFDDFIAALVERMEALRVGDPTDESTDVGSLATPGQFEKVKRYIELGQSSARMVTGGLPEPGAFGGGFFARPTLFVTDLSSDVPLISDEIFGPILTAMPFTTYDEVVAAANGVAYGLTASVWTRDLGTALRASRDLEAGYVWMNWSSTHLPGTPFGGVKASGVGREEGLDELLGYTQCKNVYIRYDM
jgi:betaine-aldehyde dehydrogenase